MCCYYAGRALLFHVLHLVFYSLKLLDVSNGWGHGTCLTETDMYNEFLE